MPFAVYYLQMNALATGILEDYSALTVRHTTNQMVEYFSEGDIYNQKEEVSLAMAREVVRFRVNIERFQPQPSQKSNAQEHLLSFASNIGCLPLVQHLARSVNVNSGSYVLGKPLLNAAWKGHPDVVQFLLNEGADPEDGTKFETELGLSIYFEKPIFVNALEAAALGGHKQVAQLLLESYSKDPRSSHSFFKATAYAAIGGNIDLLEFMSKKADFNTHSEKAIQEFWTHTLKVTAWHGRTKTIPFLLKAGAQINHSDSFERCKGSPLGYAALRGHNNTIQLFLELGADINGEPHCEEGPISLAAHIYGFPRTVELLLNQGAPIHPVASRLLEQAIMYSPTCVIEVMLKEGVHKRREDGGEMALEIAMEEERQDVVELLKLYGVNITN